MAHFTIYRGEYGLPAWATVTGAEGDEELTSLAEQLQGSINAGVVVFAFCGEHTVEVV